MSGNFNDAFVWKLIGHVHQARWITCGSSILRLYMQTQNPSIWLTKIVTFILNVYALNLFNIKKNSDITEGSRNLFTMVKNAKELLFGNEDEFDIFKKKLLNNSYFLHVEYIILGLLSDSSVANRAFGVELVLYARYQNQHIDGVRPFLKIQENQVNWDAQNYYDFIKLDSLQCMTEPSVTMDLSESDLQNIIYGSENVINLCGLEKTPCHTQAVERNVANTTLASETVIGQNKRHGFLLLLEQTREKFNGRPTKEHFVQCALQL